ncbi:MAG: hypothetical protein ACRCY8_02980 [Dermatophilaceae bacterium]
MTNPVEPGPAGQRSPAEHDVPGPPPPPHTHHDYDTDEPEGDQ